MSEKLSTYCYCAFGLSIESEIPIEMLLTIERPESIDVKIFRRDLSEYQAVENGWRIESMRTFFQVDGVARFLIENGNIIFVDSVADAPAGKLAVFLLGSCMGAIIHQRGMFPLHGSCVAKDGKAVLITGDSGAGKSSLAAQFLRNGWKLLTDDVAVVKGIEQKVPMVQPSYPSQKLWQDAIDRIQYEGDLLPLFQEERREKFNVRVREFCDKPVELKLLVRLMPTEKDCQVEEITGFTRVDQLMKNTYRIFMIDEKDWQRHFQRCVTLGSQLPMLAVLRASDRDTTGEIYQKIVDFLKEQ